MRSAEGGVLSGESIRRVGWEVTRYHDGRAAELKGREPNDRERAFGAASEARSGGEGRASTSFDDGSSSRPVAFVYCEL